ncbi:MAG TPA: MmcQ/YjbR family DNA-binding protein [Candidatus Dormibacteraeota bacterium]|nr:MmcQ/YjbR family DNA-binding protein [Candidatus Dormibacteraeota bacterium]
MTTFDDVRRIALALPEAEERLTWETDITFRVRDKIFAIGGEGADRVSVKASLETQAELIDLDPETFASSAYVGRFGWVTVDLDRVDPALLASLMREAWRRSAPKRLAATLEDA